MIGSLVNIKGILGCIKQHRPILFTLLPLMVVENDDTSNRVGFNMNALVLAHAVDVLM